MSSALYNNTINEVVKTDQRIYDAFNDLIFSSDIKIIAKLLARADIIQRVQSVPGDIVELGVFKGSGVASFLKLKDIFYPAISPMKVIGFDFFDTDDLINSLIGDDKEKMNSLFVNRDFKHTNGALNNLRETFAKMGYNDAHYELVPGDINISVKQFIKQRPGFRARLVYVDVDLEEPTFNALEALWPVIPKGGYVVLDEYGIHQWSEAKGADNFFSDKQVVYQASNLPCPTVYVEKI